MPLIFQYRIFRQDLKANPNIFYVFGDNVKRQGFGGQAKEMRGEPNAIGIATKWAPSYSEESFFSDRDFFEIRRIICKDFLQVKNKLSEKNVVIWPIEGIGTGLSQLQARAPKVNQLVLDLFNEMKKYE